jgi:hypothetical protein
LSTREIGRVAFAAFLAASALYQSFWGDGWSAAIFGVLIGYHILAPWANGRSRPMADKITEWWGKLVVALHDGHYEILAVNDIKGQVVVQTPDGKVFAIEYLGATAQE